MKYNNLKYIVRFISLFCASFIAVFTIFCQFSISAFAVHSGGGGSFFGGVEGDTFTGAEIKALAEQYKSQYQPMPTTTQYKYSYQSLDLTNSTPFNIHPAVPVYMSGYGSWGKKNWSGVYILPFLEDDDLSFNSFYCSRYYHFYSSISDDKSVILHRDIYSLEDNSLISSTDIKWAIDKYPYVGFNISSSSSAGLSRYTSYSNYMTYTTDGTGFMSGSVDASSMIASDYSSNNTGLVTLRKSVTFTPDSNDNDDWGFYLSSEPFYLFVNQTSIDFDKIPDNYTITINGDTIYDYSITNPDTGDTSTINEYVTNNYTYITNNNGGDSGGSSGTSSGDVNVGGNVTVSGDVNVGGEINIKTDPIDINVNVNGGGSGVSGSSEASGVQFDEDVSLNNYYDWMNEQTSGFSGFMSQFFSWLPADIVVLLCAGFACVILARFLGR